MYLYDIHDLTATGEQVNDAWLGHIARMPELRQLTLKKAKCSSTGFKPLAEKNQLGALQIMYAPLDGDTPALLAGMNRLLELRLYGTGISAEAAQLLVAKLDRTRVDIRRGGFLGIGVQPLGEGVIISNVQPGSAAARAGIQLGDVLLSFGGEKIANFEQLQAAIGRVPPGDSAELELLRNDKPEKLKLMLGEWE